MTSRVSALSHLLVQRPARSHLLLPTLVVLLCASLIALLPLTLAGLLLATVSFGLALLRWPVIGLYALALAIPLGPVLRLPLSPAAVGLTDLLIAATLAAWLLKIAGGKWQRANQMRLSASPLLWLILPFFLALLYSTLAAQSLERAIPELIKWAEVAVLYFLASQLIERQHRLPLILMLLFAAGGEALIGLRQFLLRIGPEAYQLGPNLRAYGTFGQPNPFAGYLGLSLPLGVATSVWAITEVRAPQPWLERRQLRLALAALALILTALIAAGLVASWSRGGWLGALLAVLAVLALISLSGRILLLAGAAAGIVAYPLLPAAISARVSDIARYFGTWNARDVPVTDANFSILERVAHWQAAWQMFADHLWLGVGVGNWDIAYPAYAIGQWLDPMGHAHNALFHYAAVAGLVGAITYGWFWLGGLGAALLAVSRNSGLDRAIAVGVVGLFIHLSVHNQFDNLFVQGMPLIVALALSLLVIRPAELNPTT